MSYRGFGRARGYAPRGVRAKGSFGRPCFPHAPFRHAGPLRPGHPGSFGPWQPNNNMFHQPPLLRGNPQFRPRGRGRRGCEQFMGPRLPAPDCDEIVIAPPPVLPSPLPPPPSASSSSNPQIEHNRIDNAPQPPLLGSEEERQQKITETANRLKQKLSSFSSDEMTDIWSDDVSLPFDTIEDGCIENRGIPELRYEPPELTLTYNDLKDIGRINPNNSKLDTSENATDIFSDTGDINNDVMLIENEDGSQVEMTSSHHQMPELEAIPDNSEHIEVENWEFHKSADNFHNLEQSANYCEDNIEDELLQSDLQCEYHISESNQDQCHQQVTEAHLIDATNEQDVSETLNLQNMSLPIDSTDQDILQKTISPSDMELETNSEVQEAVLSPHVYMESSNNNNCALSQPTLANPAVNDVGLDNHQLPKMKENSFYNRPPQLSPHTEQPELPVDFDPTTPPPTLLKQDQPRALPTVPMYDLPPLFDPTEPPPNMRYIYESQMPHENTLPAWGINENQVSANNFNNIEVHTEMNTHGQIFPPSHIDTMNFSPLFPMTPNVPIIETSMPPVLIPIVPQFDNTYVPPAPAAPQEPLPISNSQCNANKDDGLDDMQEAMKFAKQMTDIIETKNEEVGSKLLPPIESVNESIEFISLPPGRPKIDKLKRSKRDDNKQSLPEEQKASSDILTEEIVIQDAPLQSKDVSLTDEQDRPKVVFNLNNKTKKVDTKTWKEDVKEKEIKMSRTKRQKKNGMTKAAETEGMYLPTSLATRRSLENMAYLKRNEEEKNSKRDGIGSESAAFSNSLNQITVSSHKKVQKDVYTERSQRSNISPYRRVNVQKSHRSRHAEKNESSNSEITWKNKIINRFLKMSKNEIYNMVNNTSLRKFDVIMKRLVKEKKPTLSLEMRHAQDEKMKQYDQQEFMKQLNAMLDPAATVAITDLPTEFIHHLNEVLQLDVLPNNYVESAATSISGENSYMEDAAHVFDPVIYSITECVDKTAASSTDVNQEIAKSKSHTAKASDRDAQALSTKVSDFSARDDTCSIISNRSNKSNASSRLSALQHDLDDIFSEVTKKNQIPVAALRKDCSAGQRSARRSDDGIATAVTAKSIQREAHFEEDRVRTSENCALWVERCSRWKRKEQEDPDAYRNLTKEEWEAKYGTQAAALPLPPLPSSSFTVGRMDTNDDNDSPSDANNRNSQPRRCHSSESSKQSNTKPKTVESNKHRRSRRYSDDKRYAAEYPEDSNNGNNNNNSRSSSSSSSSSTSSNSSDKRGANENVMKLLRVIKEKEKVAKKMTLNEAIRDEVNAEIERERKQKSKKSRKNRKKEKSKLRKEKRARHKRNKKQRSKVMSSSDDSSSQDENTEQEITRLLAEHEIKKEREDQVIVQEVIIKEELDICQDTVDAEFANVSSRIRSFVENKAPSSFIESRGKLESFSLVEETPTMMAVNTVQVYVADDRPPTASPTQPKTKAQLKQMPETAGMNDSKAPQDASTGSVLANIPGCRESLNKRYQTAERDESETEVLTEVTNDFASRSDAIANTAQISCGESPNENHPISRQLDATKACTSVETPIDITNTPDGNETSSATADVSNKPSTAITSASQLVSSAPITSVPPKQGTCKKIDIKTYYERTIQRRKNEQQAELKRSAEEPPSATTTTRDLPSAAKIAPKTTEEVAAINKSIPIIATVPVYDSTGIKDPRLVSPARLAALSSLSTVGTVGAVNQNNIAQTISGKNIREAQQTTKRSEAAESAPKQSVVNVSNAVAKNNKDKLKHEKISLTPDTNINALPDVAAMPQITSPKSKKRVRIEASVTDDKSQSQVPSDPKRFKNIRSEGGKELKLKKEGATKVQKAKRKPTTSKSASLLPTKAVYCSEAVERDGAENAEKVTQEKEADSIGDVNKIEIEQDKPSIAPRANKIHNNNNNNAEVEPTKISSENIDNNNSELSRDVDKTKECSSNLEFSESSDTKEEEEEEDASEIKNADAREHLSSKSVQNEEACNVERANDARTSIEIGGKESYDSREILNAVPELGESAADKIGIETEISDDIENKENLSSSDETTRQPHVTKDTDFSSDYVNQAQAQKLDKQDSLESTNDRPTSIEEYDLNDIPESHMISQLDDIDVQGKENQFLTNTISNIDINDTNENDMESDAYQSANVVKDSPPLSKTAQLSPISNENFQEQQSTEEGVISPESVGSPFKGFLPDSIMAFGQPAALFNLGLDEIDAGKEDKLLLDNSNVNCTADTDNCKEMEVEREQNYETLQSIARYANDMNINTSENFNITFDDDVLLASDKESGTNERNDKSNLMVDESKEGKESSNEIISVMLREDNDVSISEDGDTEKRYASSTELVVKESVFINEEEIIQDEVRTKDFANKLTTTTDPSLSDALDTTTSDEVALRLPDIQSEEQFNNHMYLDANMSAEKNPCDKLADFDPDEHLDNDMFYLDVRLQNTATPFNSKDDASAHFSDHQPPPQFDITPMVSPETVTTVTHCSDLSHGDAQKPEQRKFDFKRTSSTDSDCNVIARRSVERSPIDTPRTLNIPTKAALKEAATNVFLKSANLSTPIEEARMLEKTQQNEETRNNIVTVTQDFTNANTTSKATASSQGSTRDTSVHKDIVTDQTVFLTPSVKMEKYLHGGVQRNPVVELRKMKELDSMVERRAQENSEKARENSEKARENSEKIRTAVYKDRKKHKDRMLRKLKDNHQMKYRSKKQSDWKKNLTKKLENTMQSGKVIGTTREAILARMLEIDIAMQKLVTEKLQLHEMLRSNVSTAGNSTSTNPTGSAEPKAKESDVISIGSGISPTLTSLLMENAETSRAQSDKYAPSSRQTPISEMKQKKQKKRAVPHSSEDDEIAQPTPRVKTPVIRWKKIPRLEQAVRRKDREEEEKDEGTEQQGTSSPLVSKKSESSVDTSKNVTQKSETGAAATDCELQSQRTNAKIDKKAGSNIDKSSKHASLSAKSADNQSGSRDSVEGESKGAECFSTREDDVEKRNDGSAPSSEAARVTCRSSSVQVQARSTPEPASIYSDDSTWDSLMQNTKSEMRKKKTTGLALLEETYKKELAMSRKVKAIARKQKKKQLNNYLRRVNNLTMEEEELPLSKLYIRKLHQKRDLLDSLSQRMEEANSANADPKIMENMEEIINAVAENRVGELYGCQTEARASNDIPTTSNNVSSVLQPSEKDQFYVDVEANANLAWPCGEKEGSTEEVAPQRQNSSGIDETTRRAFTVVNQDKTSVYDERNVEPDSSVTPAETLVVESHSSDYEHVEQDEQQEPNNMALRNFDIKVSVPKTLIRDEFSLELLKFKDTEHSNVAGTTILVDSTTNAPATNAVEIREDNRDREKNSQNTAQTATSIAEGDKRSEGDSGTKSLEKEDEQTREDANDNEGSTVTCKNERELQKQETTEGAIVNVQTAPPSSVQFKYQGATECEDSADSIASNRYDKIATIDITRDSSTSDSITAKVDSEPKKLDAESEQLSNDASATSRQDYRHAVNVEEDERSNSESRSRMSEEILSNDQRAGSPVSADPTSDKWEDSNEMSNEGRRSLERASTPSFDKAISALRSGDTNKKSINRKKQGKSATVVRRSSRCVSENARPDKDKASDKIGPTSSSGEQESSVHERDLTTRRRSKSPISAARDEKIANVSSSNAKKIRAQKAQQASARKAPVDDEPETKIESLAKHASYLTTVTNETIAASKSKVAVVGRKRKYEHTRWQMMNCKVRLVDCRHLLAPDVSPEVLRRLGIVAVNPYACPSGRASCGRDIATISVVTVEKSALLPDKSNDKDKSETEILEDRSIERSDDHEPVRESTSRASLEVDEEEPAKTQYTVHKGPILDIKVFENSFLAASEDGKIYRYSQASNGILNIYKGHKAAVTCLYICKSNVMGVNKDLMYSGSLDTTLRCYNITSGALVKNPVQVNSAIQCMDQAWGTIFIGSKSGHVSRFHIKNGIIKANSIQFSDMPVLALKATNEGVRRILIVASRNQPITIRDAQTGLFLRTISGQRNHTVYSLMRHHNLIYCGTSSTSINVFDFTTGEQTIQYDAGVGIVCMRLYEQLLFAGCYDGNIYIFDTKNHKLVCSIPGPGNMLLSIEVVYKKIIAGSKDKRLHSWQMPKQVRALLH